MIFLYLKKYPRFIIIMDNEDKKQLNGLQELIDGIKLAQKRGAYTLEESAKLWEAIKIFIE